MTQTQFQRYLSAWRVISGRFGLWIEVNDDHIVWRPPETAMAWTLRWSQATNDLQFFEANLAPADIHSHGIDALLAFEEEVDHYILDLEMLAA